MLRAEFELLSSNDRLWEPVSLASLVQQLAGSSAVLVRRIAVVVLKFAGASNTWSGAMKSVLQQLRKDADPAVRMEALRLFHFSEASGRVSTL